MALGFALLPLGQSAIFAGATEIGIGFAVVMPNFVAIALALAPPDRRGLAGGILTTSVFLGQFCSPLVSLPSIAAIGFDGTFRGTTLLLAGLEFAAVMVGGVGVLRRALGRA